MNDSARGQASGRVPVVEADRVRVTFPVRESLFKRPLPLRAVHDVSLTIHDRQIYALVGESGSGKSTTGRALLRLVPIESGSVRVGGVDITDLGGRELRPLRRDMQMVFQDPYSSLDPSATVADIIAEPLVVHESLSRKDRDARVRELLNDVGLSPKYAERYPYEFSGGQRQRIAIARAVALHPRLVVLDEAVSALDVSTQNQVLQLLENLRESLGVAYLFISHDVAVVRWLADRIAVMYLGHIVEEGPTEQVCSTPAHPYTESLLSAVPKPVPRSLERRERIVLTGELPDPLRPPPGCVFQTRCPRAMDVCTEVEPPPTTLPDGGWVACHLYPTSGDAATDVAPAPVNSTAAVF